VAIVQWCGHHGYVWVTADMRSAETGLVTAALQQQGVSAIWIQQSSGNMKLRDLLFVVARDLRTIVPILEASSRPLYFVCALHARPRPIDFKQKPTIRPGRPRRKRRG